MRYFLFFFLSSTFIFAQKRVTLQIKGDDKPSAHGFSYWGGELKISSADTSFYYQYHTTSPDVIPNLKKGEYTVMLSSVFNDREIRRVNLKKRSTLVKFSGLNSYFTQAPEAINLSEKLKVNDTLFIIFNTIGGDINYEKLGITKTSLGYTVLQYQGLTSDIFQTMQFDEAKYQEVKALEIAGKKANAPKAITAPVAEVYTFKLGREISTFIVPGNWGGFTRLKLVLLAIQR